MRDEPLALAVLEALKAFRAAIDILPADPRFNPYGPKATVNFDKILEADKLLAAAEALAHQHDGESDLRKAIRNSPFV